MLPGIVQSICELADWAFLRTKAFERKPFIMLQLFLDLSAVIEIIGCQKLDVLALQACRRGNASRRGPAEP